MLVRVAAIGMVNIIAGRKLCPEFVQGEATPDALARALCPLLEDSPERTRVVDGLKEVSQSLGPGGVEERAADIILEELGPNPHTDPGSYPTGQKGSRSS